MPLTDKGRKDLSDYATSRQRGEGGQFIEAEEAHERADRLQRELDTVKQERESFRETLCRLLTDFAPGDWVIEDSSVVGLMIRAQKYRDHLKDKEQRLNEHLGRETQDRKAWQQDYAALNIKHGELLAKLDNPTDHAAALAAIDSLKDRARHLQDGAQQLQREKTQLSNQVAEEERQNVAIAISFGILGLLLGGAIMKVMGW